MKWRVVQTDGECLDGVTAVCEMRDPLDASFPAHHQFSMEDCCSANVMLRVPASDLHDREAMAAWVARSLTWLDVEVCR